MSKATGPGSRRRRRGHYPGGLGGPGGQEGEGGGDSEVAAWWSGATARCFGDPPRVARVENDQVPLVPTSFDIGFGASLEAFSGLPYKSGCQRGVIPRATRCTHGFGPNQFGGYIRRKGKSLYN